MADTNRPGPRSRPEPRTQEEQDALAARAGERRPGQSATPASGRPSGTAGEAREQEGQQTGGAARDMVGGAGMVPLGEVFQLAQWAITPVADETEAAARRTTVRSILWDIIQSVFPE